MPIHLYLKKLYGRFHLRSFSLLSNHTIKSIINTEGSNEYIIHHYLSLNKLTSKQQSWLHSPLIDMDNKCNKFFPSFSPFNEEFSLGKRLIDFFSDWFSFHTWTHDIKNYICNLNNIAINISNNPYSLIILSNASIKNNIAISISYIYSHNRLVIRMIHHAVNITTTETKLFAIRCGINQAIGIPNIKHIDIVTDSLYAAKRIFDSSTHPYQIHSAAIS